MWEKVSNGIDICPDDIDENSSRNYVYVRKNIRRIEADDERPAHYEWEERKIKKDIWPLFHEQMQKIADLEFMVMMAES